MKTVDGRYLLNNTLGESFSLVQKALIELDLKDLKTKRSVSSSYILVEYKAGWFDKRKIEFTFKDRQPKTEVSIKWFYPSYEEWESMFGKRESAFLAAQEKKERAKTERLLEELRCRIGGVEMPAADDKVVREKEIVKEVIVKVRCAYCHNLYDETLDRCPHCGGMR